MCKCSFLLYSLYHPGASLRTMRTEPCTPAATAVSLFPFFSILLPLVFPFVCCVVLLFGCGCSWRTAQHAAPSHPAADGGRKKRNRKEKKTKQNKTHRNTQTHTADTHTNIIVDRRTSHAHTILHVCVGDAEELNCRFEFPTPANTACGRR